MKKKLNPCFEKYPTRMVKVSEKILTATRNNKPVVALETAVLTHGLPREISLRVYREMLAAVEEGGGMPAAVGVVDGVVRVGLSLVELEELGGESGARKAALPDLPVLAALGANGGTTAGATLWAARRAGIAVVATGGIGGVHQGAERTFDISGDLHALARFGGLMVCSGAKSLCDLPKTSEMLETLGVTVVGYRTFELPAFTSISSGVRLAHRVENPRDAAGVVAARDMLGLPQAVLLVNPPPVDVALGDGEAASALEGALQSAAEKGITGPALTPFLLSGMERLTTGRSLAANRALLAANARLAAEVAVSLTAMQLTA